MSDDDRSHPEEEVRRGLTRRALFKGAGAAAAAGAVFGALDASAKDETDPGPRVQGPGKTKMTLRQAGWGDPGMAAGAGGGWSQAFDKLDAELPEIAA